LATLGPACVSDGDEDTRGTRQDMSRFMNVGTALTRPPPPAGCGPRRSGRRSHVPWLARRARSVQPRHSGSACTGCSARLTTMYGPADVCGVVAMRSEHDDQPPASQVAPAPAGRGLRRMRVTVPRWPWTGGPLV